jgi:trigger factor
MSAQQYGMDPNQFAQAIDQQGQVPAMVAEVARRKALAAVLEKVTIVDTEGNTVDLNELNERPGVQDALEALEAAEAAEGAETAEAEQDEAPTDEAKA